MALLLLLFLSIGFLLKRNLIFAGIAIVVISFIFTIKQSFNINSSTPKIKKFNFSFGDDEE